MPAKRNGTGIVVAVLIVVAIVVAVAIRYGAQRVDSVVASTVERYGSAVTGTDVDVDGVELALTAGRATFGAITIDNPPGYDTDYAVRVGRASVEIDVASLTGDVPVVEEIVLDGALINAELRDADLREAASNLTDIQRNATSAPSDAAAAGEPGRIVVERFRVTNARVLVTSQNLDEPEELPLGDVVVENIGGTTGTTYSEAAEAMLVPVMAAARSAAVERVRGAARDALSDAAREKLEDRVDELRDRL